MVATDPNGLPPCDSGSGTLLNNMLNIEDAVQEAQSVLLRGRPRCNEPIQLRDAVYRIEGVPRFVRQRQVRRGTCARQALRAICFPWWTILSGPKNTT